MKVAWVWHGAKRAGRYATPAARVGISRVPWSRPERHSSSSFRIDHSSATAGQLPLTRFLYSVYVLIAFALREYRVIDRSDDPKGKLQLAVF